MLTAGISVDSDSIIVSIAARVPLRMTSKPSKGNAVKMHESRFSSCAVPRSLQFRFTGEVVTDDSNSEFEII